MPFTHNRLGANYVRAQSGWPLRYAGKDVVLPVTGNARASDGEALRHLALTGLGLARLAVFQIHGDIAAGRLLPVLENCNSDDIEEVHAVYVGQAAICPCAREPSWAAWPPESISERVRRAMNLLDT